MKFAKFNIGHLYNSPKLTIISGGQTGVDRAALDISVKWGITYRGWCPAGRWAEDGFIHERYMLQMTPSADPTQRTIWNVLDSYGLLIIGSLNHSNGTNLAYKTANDLRIPILQPQLVDGVASVIKWLESLEVPIINIAGPRESEDPGIYTKSSLFLDELITTIKKDQIS